MWWSVDRTIVDEKKAMGGGSHISLGPITTVPPKGKAKDKKTTSKGDPSSGGGLASLFYIVHMCLINYILIFFFVYHVYGFATLIFSCEAPTFPNNKGIHEDNRFRLFQPESIEAEAHLGMAALFLAAIAGAVFHKADLLIPSFVGCAIHALLGVALFFADAERLASVGYIADSCGSDYQTHRGACDAVSILRLFSRLAYVFLCLICWSNLHKIWLYFHREDGTLPASQKNKPLTLL